MVFFGLTGGLGNQFFIYAAARKYGKCFNVKVKFDVSNYNFDFRELELNKFNSNLLFVNKFDLFFFKINVIYFLNVFRFLIKNIPTFIQEDFSKINDNLFLYKKNVFFRGYWQRNIYFDGQLSELRSELNLLDKFKSADFFLIEKKITDSQSVSVHIRRSDYLNSKNADFFEVLSINYYHKAFKKISETLDNPVYYFFADDLKWVNDNFKNFSNSIFVSEIINDSAQEFELMKKCKHNIISNSTFSWWAAYLNDYKCKLIIAPNNFYKEKKIQNQYANKKLFFLEEAIYL